MEKFKGCPYPIVHKPTGYFGHTSGVEQIKACLLSLFLTAPNTRVMLLEYGTPLNELIFDPNDGTIVTRAHQMVVDAINRWEPRVPVTAIDVSIVKDRRMLNPADDLTEIGGILSIKVMFRDPDDITEIHALSLDVPLSGGN